MANIKKNKEPLIHIAKRDDIPSWSAWLIRLGAILVGFTAMLVVLTVLSDMSSTRAAGIGDVLNIFMLFAPVALVVLAEHIADHKNLSSIIGQDLLEEPGLHRTLLGDGVGSIVGAFFGGCPNTTYGESVGCVAITGNASISTIAIAAIYCIVLSFFDPFVAFVNSIPSCITGGVCIALYGFIAVSGLKMFKNLDLGDNKNLFVVSSILISGIGGLTIQIPYQFAENGAVSATIQITGIAPALIIGITTNAILSKVEKSKATASQED